MVGDEYDLAVGDTLQMPSVLTLAVTCSGLHQLVAHNPTVLIGDLCHNHDRQALRTLHRTHKLPRLERGIHRARVQPRVATPQRAHV